MELFGISSTEWIGYIASVLLIISFMMKDIRTLRVINSLGCAFFIIYGFLLAPTSWPIIITNSFIVLFNLYYLFFTKE